MAALQAYASGWAHHRAAAYSGATASMTNVTVTATGQNTTVAARVLGRSGGWGFAAMGVAASYKCAAAAIENVVFGVSGPGTTVAVSLAGGAGEGAAVLAVGFNDAANFIAAGSQNRITRCPGVSVLGEGAPVIARRFHRHRRRCSSSSSSSRRRRRAPQLPTRVPATSTCSHGGLPEPHRKRNAHRTAATEDPPRAAACGVPPDAGPW